MQSFGNIRTVYKLLTFRTRHKGNGPKVAEIHVLENMSEVVKCNYSNRTEKENVDLERSTFFNPRSLMPLEKRMDVRLTIQI